MPIICESRRHQERLVTVPEWSEIVQERRCESLESRCQEFCEMMVLVATEKGFDADNLVAHRDNTTGRTTWRVDVWECSANDFDAMQDEAKARLEQGYE